MASKIIFIWAAIMVFGESYGGVKANSQNTHTKELKCVVDTKWTTKAGLTFWMFHDRLDLGFVLPANTTLKLRQAHSDSSYALKIMLLGSDSREEKAITVGPEWQTMSGEVDLVPFVNTPWCSPINPKLEYEIMADTPLKPLPIYTYKSNESVFFNIWDETDSSYALIQTNDFQLLLPKRDKELARSLESFASLDSLIESYTELFAFYNELAGFDNSSPLNQKFADRFFLKADLHGAGEAYYSNDWLAESHGTAQMWLRFTEDVPYEISRGYEAGFNGKGMNTDKVLRELFATTYLYKKYGINANTKTHLYDSPESKETLDKNLYEKMIGNNSTFDSGSEAERLLLLALLTQKASNKALTKMYQGYRALANESNFEPNDYRLPDLVNQHFSQHSKLDFTPVLHRWGIPLKFAIGEHNRAQNFPAVASIADIIPENMLESAHSLLDGNLLITSNFEIVKNSEVEPLGLQGHLNVHLLSEDIQEFQSHALALRDGEKTVQQQVITGAEVLFENVANGVYKIDIVGNRAPLYTQDIYYVYVKEIKNNVNITLTRVHTTRLSQSIRFLGIGNDEFANFKTVEDKATFTLNGNTPHHYFNGKLYAKITVRNKYGTVQYEKAIDGMTIETGSADFTLEEGDTVEIYHAESWRLKPSEIIIDTINNTNHWLVTKYGLEHERQKSLNGSLEKYFMKKIDSEGKRLLSEDSLKNMPVNQCDSKKQLLSAIRVLEEPWSSEYANKYAILFPNIVIFSNSKEKYCYQGSTNFQQ